MSKHGTFSRYAQGCRCEPCGTANRDYHRAYRARTRPEAAGKVIATLPDFPALGAAALAGLAANA